MNLTLKAVYYCATNNRSWGKGFTIEEAKKGAGIYTKADEKRLEFKVVAVIFDNPTPEELENLCQCITANQVHGSAEFYRDNRTEADTKMINDKLVGWLQVEKNYTN